MVYFDENIFICCTTGKFLSGLTQFVRKNSEKKAKTWTGKIQDGLQHVLFGRFIGSENITINLDTSEVTMTHDKNDVISFKFDEFTPVLNFPFWTLSQTDREQYEEVAKSVISLTDKLCKVTLVNGDVEYGIIRTYPCQITGFPYSVSVFLVNEKYPKSIRYDPSEYVSVELVGKLN